MLEHKKYSSLIKDDEIIFKAMVVETLGGWCDEAIEVISFLASALAKRNPFTSYALELKRLYEKYSVSLQRNNARMILSRINDIPLSV